MKRIKISESAEADLVDGYKFYEEQEPGLGDYFLDSLYADIDSLFIYAGISQTFYKKYYRLLSKRFPFAIYYSLTEDLVYVKAVLDCRRKPSWNRRKLQ